jgi:hypothetical protein
MAHPLRVTLLSAVVGLCACVMPSDQGDEVVVAIDAPTTLLVRGRTVMLTAHAWRRGTAGELTELPGVAFDWRTLRPDLATVDPRSDGTALVTPVNEGRVGIRASASEFADAAPDTVELRVANPFTIDSVRPATVRYGEQVTLFGVGLGDLASASLGPGDLIPDPATFAGQAQGEGRLGFWVPYPAASDRLGAVSRRGSTTVAPDTTTVLPLDLYHELNAPPPEVDLDGPAVRGPDTLFHNPALAIVPGEGPDAFHFHRSQAGGSLTFVVASTGPVVTLFNPVLTAERNVPASFPTDDPISTWAVGFSGQYCRNRFIDIGRPVSVAAPVTLVRAVRNVPQDLLLVVYGDPSGRYAVTVRDGYVTADPSIVPDRLEENDDCTGADANAAAPDRSVVLAFADTLTIDNPYETDWLRFDVPGDPEEPGDSLVTIRTAARPFGATDSSNVGLMLLRADQLDIVAQSRTPGSSEAITARLIPGPYYLLVVDDGGVATRYSVCLGYGSSCGFVDER